MNDLGIIIMASWLAGFAAFLGAVAAHLEGSDETMTKREVTHGVMAFGGGILLSAVAFALLPEGIEILNADSLVGIFCAGGMAFCVLDVYLSRQGQSQAQLIAMLMDFIPEAISLGAVFGHDRQLGLLLAAFIAAQNLPEGFNSYRETMVSSIHPRMRLTAFLGISLLGPLAACVGYFFLQNQPALTAGIMVFASGGIIYLLFQDIAPQAKLQRHWTPALGAVFGVAVGLLGKKLLG